MQKEVEVKVLLTQEMQDKLQRLTELYQMDKAKAIYDSDEVLETIISAKCILYLDKWIDDCILTNGLMLMKEHGK